VSTLNRVPVDVINMTGEIFFVPNQMLPKAPLPDAPFTPLCPARGQPLTGGNQPGKTRLDQTPAGRKIGIARGQRPQAMQMLEQDHNGIDLKGMPRFYIPKCLAQGIHPFYQQAIIVSFSQCNSEKPGRAKCISTPISRHFSAIIKQLLRGGMN